MIARAKNQLRRLLPKNAFARGVSVLVGGTASGQLRPMFPRYLFVQPEHAEQSIAPVKSTRGVSHLVRQGTALVACPETLIDSIRNAEAQLNGEKPTAFVAVGETIEIVEGPFQGLISCVVAATEDRVSILLEVLGKLQSIEFPIALCRKV